MKKNFRFGLAVFAMLLLSAACQKTNSADNSPTDTINAAGVSWKDKRCEGAWVDKDGEGFYFTNGKVYGISDGKWYENSVEIDYRHEDYIHTPSIYYYIMKIEGNKMYIMEAGRDGGSPIVIHEKLSKIPPKGD